MTPVRPIHRFNPDAGWLYSNPVRRSTWAIIRWNAPTGWK